MELGALIAAALAAGFLGSLHCAAMCGPLAIAAATRGGRTEARQAAAYALGRFASYAAVGALMGAIGQHALCKLPVATVEWFAVILVAGAAAWRGIVLLVGRRRAPAKAAAGTVRLTPRPPRRTLTARLYALVPRRAGALGLVTGILPCGMLVPAWALAASSARPASGALVMLAFATASLPGLLLPVVGRRALTRVAARLPARAHGVAWCLLAVWIALRPLLASAHHHH